MAKLRREISGRFCGENFVFISDDGEIRKIVGTIETDDGPLAVTGEAAAGQLVVGLTFRFYGGMKPYTNRKTGIETMQFAFENFTIDTPAGMEAVVTYLEQLPGIGFAKSGRLWELYGENAVAELRTNPEAVAVAMKWDVKKAIAAADKLTTWQSIEATKIDLLGLLHGRGLPKKTIEKLIERYGSAAGELVRRNPYFLMEFRGCGFGRADKLYTDLGKNPLRLKRQSLCIAYGLAQDREGHTWHSIYAARKALRDAIAGAEPDLERAVMLATRAGLLAERFDATGGRWIADGGQARAEQAAAEYIEQAEHDNETPFSGIDLAAIAAEVSEHQLQQLNRASGTIGILAGSPGTGKTYTAAALIRYLIERIGSHHIAVCAPTGKAAVRVTEAMANNGVKKTATTIHSLLGVIAGGDDGIEFDYGPGNPLPYKIVVIDEASMIDTSLACDLLAARGRGTCYLFVGDPNQLSPVGHGAPLRDMIAAGVPTGTLTEIQRNSGRIIRACAEIREGKKFATSPQIDLDAGENLKLVAADGAADQIETLRGILTQIATENPQRYDPIWDVQILCAVNKKSELGRKPLNAILQSLLNPRGATCPGSPFRVGDKIINGKNGWFPAVEKTSPGVNKKGQFYVANGEQAEVLKVEARRTIARLTSPDRLIVIPRGAANEDDGEDSTGTGCNWELGYAISCHKSQGSEWKIVIVMLDDYGGARQVCSRQWLYTGCSRGKTLCLLIGKIQTAYDMVNRDALFNRKTFLVESINRLRFNLNDILKGAEK